MYPFNIIRSLILVLLLLMVMQCMRIYGFFSPKISQYLVAFLFAQCILVLLTHLEEQYVLYRLHNFMYCTTSILHLCVYRTLLPLELSAIYLDRFMVHILPLIMCTLLGLFPHPSFPRKNGFTLVRVFLYEKDLDMCVSQEFRSKLQVGDCISRITKNQHMIFQDVSSKIMAFSQNVPRAVCILSCSGVISDVTLHQAATSGGTATYQGRFDILSLSGSFLLSEISGQKSRIGGLSVTLSGSDGRVLGGCVAGLLIAASPVQVIVGSFLADGRKELKSANHVESLFALPKADLGGASGANSSPSRGTLSESSGGPASPLNLSSGGCNINNNLHGISSMPWK